MIASGYFMYVNLSITERHQIENEMLFRRANEKVGTDLDEIDRLHAVDGNHHLIRNDDLTLQFECECSDENCHLRIPLRLSEYRKIHENRQSFIIKVNHQVKAIEKVVLQTPSYSVVKKNNSTPEPGPDFNKTSVNNT